ncbi:hypothetical protein [Eisenibacter elegans]|jgi:hypothetical protein|uniref:hypothetical protein n=1 Tax=Eisenibacter elegans TaxID=997 RepID=UPI000416A91F|nr:hypothetical protein [Eisenibacter elegans]
MYLDASRGISGWVLVNEAFVDQWLRQGSQGRYNYTYFAFKPAPNPHSSEMAVGVEMNRSLSA